MKIDFLIVFILIVYETLVETSSTSCLISSSLNCSCFHSNSDLSLSLSLSKTIYSHLYCQANSLNEKTFANAFQQEFFDQNYFETISLEFSLTNQIEIHRNQFQSLANLTSKTNRNSPIEITIRFVGFTELSFGSHSLTSTMFNGKHANRSLSLYFIPKIGTNVVDTEETQLKFAAHCFSGLKVRRMNLYLHTNKFDNSFKYPFEQIFNETEIFDLHFYDSIIQPGSSLLKKSFHGLIQSLTLHRRVDTIDTQTYPFYNTVQLFNIHSTDAHSIDLNSFVYLHDNLNEIELIRPHFEISIDKFLPSLKSLSIDVEFLNERTLLSARHISKLKLGSNLHRINPNVFQFNLNHLKTFDLSQIDLLEMISDSRCFLIKFIIENFKRIHFLYPKVGQLNACHCIRLIFNEIQSIQLSNEQNLCSKQCRFTDCPAISQYFTNKYSFDRRNNNEIAILNEENEEDLPSIDLYSDRNDFDIITFLTNQSTYKHDDESSFETEQNQSKSLASKSNVFVGTMIVIVIVVVSLLVCFIVKYQKKKDFTRVPSVHV